jgi:hypothetical protein
MRATVFSAPNKNFFAKAAFFFPEESGFFAALWGRIAGAEKNTLGKSLQGTAADPSNRRIL